MIRLLAWCEALGGRKWKEEFEASRSFVIIHKGVLAFLLLEDRSKMTVKKTQEELSRELKTLRAQLVALQQSTAEGKRALRESEHLVERQMQRETVLHEITLAITSTLDLRAVLDVLLEKIDLLLPYAAATVRLLNRETGDFEPIACRNIDVDDWKAGSGRGFVREIMESKAPVISINVQKDLRARGPDFFRKHGLVSFLAVPLIAKGEILGILSFYTREERQFSKEEVEFLSSLAGQAAIAIHNSQLYEQVKKRTQELSALYSVATAVNQSLDLESLLRGVMHKVLEIFNFDATSIYLFDNNRNELRLLTHQGFPKDAIPPSSRRSGQGITGRVFETGQPLLFEDIQNDPKFSTVAEKKFAGFRGHFSIPVSVKRKTVGVIHFLSKEVHRFSARESQLINAITNHVGIAVENSQLYEETKRQAAQLEEDIAQIQQLERQQAESEKLAATGRMAARIAHEINNPLAAIKNSFLLIKGAVPEDYPYHKYVGRIDKEIDRIARVVRQMFDLYRPDQESASEFLVDEAVNDVAALLEAGARQRDVLLEVETDASVLVTLPESLVRQILYNVIQNAIEASPDGGVVKIAAAVRNGSLAITVSDRGGGIQEDLRSRVFEPFFTTKSNLPGAGLGLGLSVSKSMVETMGGSLDFESQVGQGTVFRAILPLGGVQKEEQSG